MSGFELNGLVARKKSCGFLTLRTTCLGYNTYTCVTNNFHSPCACLLPSAPEWRWTASCSPCREPPRRSGTVPTPQLPRQIPPSHIAPCPTSAASAAPLCRAEHTTCSTADGAARRVCASLEGVLTADESARMLPFSSPKSPLPLRSAFCPPAPGLLPACSRRHV